MKRLFLILIVLLILPAMAFSAPFLVCDLPFPGGVISVEVVSDGIIVPDTGILFTVNSDDNTKLNLIDVESAIVGPHNYRARWIWGDTSEWPGPGEWSVPLDVTKPGEKPESLDVKRLN